MLSYRQNSEGAESKAPQPKGRIEQMLGAIFKAASQQYLDISMDVSRSHRARILERPGCWLDDRALGLLVDDMRQVAAKTLPAGELEYGVFSKDSTRLRDTIVTLITDRKTGQPVAFNALAVMSVDLGHRTEKVLHLGLVIVDPDLRSKGLSWVLYGLTCILMLFRNGMRPLWISNVTQVPAVVGLVGDGFSHVFPVPEPGPENRRSLMHLLLARGIMARHRHVFGVGADARFDDDRFVIENAYTGGSDHLKKTFEEAPKHRDEAVNTYCLAHLDYKRGDDFLQLGQVDIANSLAYVKREVPPRSFAALGLFVLAAIIQRIALPLWHWNDPSRDFGALRARKETQ